MLMLAFVVGIVWAIREGRRKGVASEVIIDCSLWVLLSSVLFARLFFIVLDWSEYAGKWSEWYKLWEGGLSFHGGLFGAVLAGVLFAWKRGLPFGLLTDVLTPSIPLGYAIARVGCFLNGCCHGVPTSLPWGVRFLARPALLGRELTPPSHPTQLYASIASLIVFGIILLLRDRVRVPGQLFGTYLAIYGLQRFIIEFWRAGASATTVGALGGLTEAQIASFALAVAAAGAVIYLNRRGRAAAAEPVEAEASPEPQPATTEASTRRRRTHR
jgi:phosphatidylglycerol:prolipoprotein diacylglycerol transferase